MRKLSTALAIALFSVFMFSCKKDLEVVNTPTTTPAATLYQGTFTSSAHTTTGSVKLIRDSVGKKFLVFDNLKTDAGPDLHIYLSDDIKATNYADLTDKVTNGSYQIEVPSTVDTDAKKKVLIWCKKFSVLFGSADLK